MRIYIESNLATGEVTFCVSLEAATPRHAYERVDELMIAALAAADTSERDVSWRQTVSRRNLEAVTG